MIKKLCVLGVALLISTAANAQKNLIKSFAETFSSKVKVWTQRQIAPTTLGTQLERQLSRPITDYHPIFGYSARLKESGSALTPVSLVQVEPILNKKHTKHVFKMYNTLNLPQTTEMIFLWRLANPNKSASWHLCNREVSDQLNTFESYSHELQNLPNRRFLLKLMDSGFLPHSYTELAKITERYPKHIELDKYGFPMPTEDINLAKELDLYLMLSNPAQMGQYNNMGPYTPFVLTKEEHEAANKLLALRYTSEELPPNPTPRDLLELAYNQLHSHTVPYTRIGQKGKNVSRNYKAYPNYRKTALYRAIKKTRQNIHTTTFPAKYYDIDEEIRDLYILHLVILDAVMGGVDPNNLKEVDKVLTAFEKLLTRVPYDEQHSRHLKLLQANLRIVLKGNSLFDFNANFKLAPTNSHFESTVAYKAWRLLENTHIFSPDDYRFSLKTPSHWE